MTIEFDKGKSEKTRKECGFGFEIAERFEAVSIIEDERKDYGEPRFRAWGFIDGEAYALVFTPRNGKMRIISLRRMHKKEMKENDLK